MAKTDLMELGRQLGYDYEPRLWPKFGKIGQYQFFTDGSGRPEYDSIINYEIKVGSLFYHALKDEIVGKMYSFAGGVCLFCLNEESNVFFDRDMKGEDTHLMAVLRDNMHFPVGFEDKFMKLCNKNFDFRDFLEHLKGDNNLFCDIDSAIFVYDLQGDEAIFHILCHVFAKISRNIEFSCPLLHDCDIKKFPKIDSFVSGTTFPVIVSPFSRKLRWQERNNGWFLETEIGKKWFVLDCLGVGHYNMGKESTSARRQYWAVGGEVVPYMICWNWLDIVEAVGQFGTDVLVRDFRTGLFDGYWFKFGPNALIEVHQRMGKIGIGGKFNTKIKVPWKTKSTNNCVINLKGDLVKKAGNNPCFTIGELHDWLELGQLCRTAIE